MDILFSLFFALWQHSHIQNFDLHYHRVINSYAINRIINSYFIPLNNITFYLFLALRQLSCCHDLTSNAIASSLGWKTMLLAFYAYTSGEIINPSFWHNFGSLTAFTQCQNCSFMNFLFFSLEIPFYTFYITFTSGSSLLLLTRIIIPTHASWEPLIDLFSSTILRNSIHFTSTLHCPDQDKTFTFLYHSASMPSVKSCDKKCSYVGEFQMPPSLMNKMRIFQCGLTQSSKRKRSRGRSGKSLSPWI